MMSTDAAVESWKEDRLGFKDYADGVIAPVERISRENTPFTIGIFGGWGSGKTSFMKIMQELLESRGYETIFFNSWEFGNEEKPWIPFMIKVVEELFEEETDRKELIRNIFLFSTDMVVQHYSQGKLSASSILDLVKKSRKTTPFREWSDEDVKNVIERVTKIDEFKKKVRERAENPPKKKIRYGISPKNSLFALDAYAYRFIISFLEKIHILKIDVRKVGKKKIIIFIDDLDRIPEKLIDFLNSLKVFLDIKGCIFILGCDYTIVESVLKKRYKEEEIYEDYFDKIVQAEFHIPMISDGAIEKFLQSLTGWSVEEIKECKQLLIHSIGRNPRKIKRVVNVTELIKSVFESKLATLIEAFKKSKPRIGIRRPGGGIEEPTALRGKMMHIYTPSKMLDILFDKKVLFKLVCMREQWPRLYERILSEKENQRNWISLQDEKNKIDILELLKDAGQKEEKLKEIEKNLSLFIKDPPHFHKEIEDIKTYLNLLEISSPEAGIVVEYTKPQNLPIHLFNRYMMFERITKGKVDESVIKEKIEHMDWDSSLSSYYFFIEVISAFEYDDLRHLFEGKKDLIKIAKAEKIIESPDLGAIGWLLDRVWLLDSVGGVDNKIAKVLVNDTKNTYAEKIRVSTDLQAIGWLLYDMGGMDNETAKQLVNETKGSHVKKIIASTDLPVIGWLLRSVRGIDEETAKMIVNETKGTYAEKIRISADPGAIGSLLYDMRGIDNEIAKQLINETKGSYVKKIIASTDLPAIGLLLRSVREIDKETAKVIVNETKNTYAEKIRASSDLSAIGSLLSSVRRKMLVNETKDTCAEKIRASTKPEAIGSLLDSVGRIDKEIAKVIVNETKNTYAEKIRASSDLWAIGSLLDSVGRIDKEIAKVIVNETKDTYAEKIRANPLGTWSLFHSVRMIDEETAKELENETKFKSEQ